MNRYVTDTHALIWHLQNLPNLSSGVRQIFSEIDGGRSKAVIPTIVLLEMIYLSEKWMGDLHLHGLVGNIS